jgi:hypothetical protein
MTGFIENMAQGPGVGVAVPDVERARISRARGVRFCGGELSIISPAARDYGRPVRRVSGSIGARSFARS